MYVPEALLGKPSDLTAEVLSAFRRGRDGHACSFTPGGRLWLTTFVDEIACLQCQVRYDFIMGRGRLSSGGRPERRPVAQVTQVDPGRKQ